MSCLLHDGVVFRAEQLLPEAWRRFASDGPVRTFNPGLLRRDDGWIFAYRIVAADGVRRIGLCLLNDALQVRDASCTPWSDQVRFRPGADYPDVARQWFADPRLYRLGGRVYVYWNSGWHEPRNHQFLQELDPARLRPIGPARELLIRGERQKLEKNWTLFAGDRGTHYAVYSILPHRILAFSLDGTDDVQLEEVARCDWSLNDYPACHGGLRGGAPPVLADGLYWSFCHSVHDAPDGYRYSAAAYAFNGKSPFAPSLAPMRPLTLRPTIATAARTYPRLNPAVGEVVYPCGAARVGTRWLVSHGINDEVSAISILEHDEVLAALRPSRVP